MRNPVEELDAVGRWLHLTDDLLAHVGQPPCTGPVRADVSAIAGWLRRHPDVAAQIGLFGFLLAGTSWAPAIRHGLASLVGLTETTASKAK